MERWGKYLASRHENCFGFMPFGYAGMIVIEEGRVNGVRGARRSLRTCVAAIAVLGVVALSPAVAGQHVATPAIAGASVGFGPNTVVDAQRLGGEPDIKVCGPSATWSYGNCGGDNPYASMPWGFSTTSSFLWRSEDGAKSFKLVPSNNGTGKPDACPGGGDSELAVSPGATQSSDYLNFADLQGLTNFSTGVSKDGGQTFTCDSLSSVATAVDRQWFGIYKNPAGAPANGSAVYLDYDITAGSSVYPSTNCALGSNAAGNAFVVQKSTDGGLTYGPFTVVDCNDGIAGNMEVNQTNGHVFAIHTAYKNPNEPAEDVISVNRSTDGGTTWSTSTVFAAGSSAACPADCIVGQDFGVLAIDKSGGLYAVWAQAPMDASGNITGPMHIFYSYSSNEGTTWSPERQVDSGSTNVNMFGWIAAGNAGAIDVVWYGTTKASDAASYAPGDQRSDWYPYLSQSFNANTSSPTFSAPVQVAQHSNHNGSICTFGIGCTTGGDRSLADFFQVSLDAAGGADVIWADTSNNGNTSASGNAGAQIDEARQISGPTLYGTTLKGTAATCTAVTSTPCVTDRTGDATYEANGIIGVNNPKLDITGASVNLDPSNSSRLDARMSVPGLTSLPKTGDAGLESTSAFVDYLVTWNYHVPGNTQANYDSTGNVYYAYLEVNTATGAVSAYDGNTCSIDTTKPKDLVYPGQNAIKYGLNLSTGTIDLYVPLTDVGNPANGTSLYSVTAQAVGQAAAAGPYTCTRDATTGNNPDPYGQLFDVYDKSPAFTTVLKSGKK